MTAAEPRWRRLEPDARREQILACAVRLFGERPYSAVSTTDIAVEAGVARGLLNHYFGTKRDLYLEVVRQMVLLPEFDSAVAATGPLRARVEASVDWFLGTVSAHGKTFVAVTGAEGVGTDPEIEQILAAADDFAARKVLETVGPPADPHDPGHRAVVRAYGGLVKAAVREWARDETLTRDQVHLLLSRALITIVRDVLPGVAAKGDT
ncbi:MAG TPA: helix-turn-helix domain-containing protein [Jatrophihabitans sp.]|jgi:AcrR family transcriptional regulator|nr:helix-turn-helix domain-containing protein [Jatrophihabitans sp.]